jgi:hypothetical protein
MKGRATEPSTMLSTIRMLRIKKSISPRVRGLRMMTSTFLRACRNREYQANHLNYTTTPPQRTQSATVVTDLARVNSGRIESHTTEDRSGVVRMMRVAL